MRRFELPSFGLENLALEEDVTRPEAGPGEVLLRVRAMSLNFRDVLVCEGSYNPRLGLPATPVSDAAGVIEAVGEGVTDVKRGDEVVTVFLPDWADGRFRDEYRNTTLGTPGPGMATELVVLPAAAVMPKPSSLSFEEAATLPCTALTAWSSMVTVGGLDPNDPAKNAGLRVLTLGTGGVSMMTLQMARALGASVGITSSSDEKLARCRDEFGAAFTANYATDPEWGKTLAKETGGGVDIIVDTAGAGSLPQSLRAIAAGGTIATLGALAGLKAEIDTGRIMMRRVTLAGIMVGSRREYADMLAWWNALPEPIRPVIDRTMPWTELPQAMADMKGGGHVGKIVLTVD